MDEMKFNRDIEIIYEFLARRDDNISKFYEAIKEENEKRLFLEEFMVANGIKIDADSLYSLASRLVNLRDDSLIQTLKKQNFTPKDIKIVKESAYKWVRDYYIKKHLELIEMIDELSLLTPFYRALFKHHHKVGVAMSLWQSSWNEHIIENINKELHTKFGEDEKVHQYLHENGLESDGDRSYSVLMKTKNSYEKRAYVEAFNETKKVIEALEEFYLTLRDIDDESGQKNNIIKYIKTLIDAFSESDTTKVISKWANVDRAWMGITSPIQIGHPLEYYEDHYRKAVALEWDIRLSNPKMKNSRVTNIKKMFESIYNTIGEDYSTLYHYNLENLDKVQLYLGRPALFYGAEFNGLFSAQVVPNDEDVTLEFGKKIFAFADKILESSRAKPFMKLPRVVFGDEFVDVQREFLMKETEKWHQLYDISTIGHEYGHTLWMDKDTESKMNMSGNFKNIEEFKATTGGLVSFFLNPEDGLEMHLLDDIIKRSVSLIGWMEVGEVEPYYCEGLIHLDILFEARVLDFEDNRLILKRDEESYRKTKELYIQTYKSLAGDYYLKKVDASHFLSKYAKKVDGIFLPVEPKVNEFVTYYYELYKQIGTQLDDK